MPGRREFLTTMAFIWGLVFISFAIGRVSVPACPVLIPASPPAIVAPAPQPCPSPEQTAMSDGARAAVAAGAFAAAGAMLLGD